MMRYIYTIGLAVAFALLVCIRLSTLVSPPRLPWLIGSGIIGGAVLSIPISGRLLRRLSASLDGHIPTHWYQKLGISRNLAFLAFPLSGAALSGLALFGTIRFGLSREAVLSLAIIATVLFVSVWSAILIAALYFERSRRCRVYLVTNVGLCAVRNGG